MAVFFIANDNITDAALMQEYFEAVTPLLAASPHEVIGYDNDAFPLERNPAGKRVLVIKFPSEDVFRAFYDSPEYQAIVGKRLAATDGFAVLMRTAD